MPLQLALLSMLIETSWAAPVCAPLRSQIQGPSEIAKYFDRIAIIGEADRKVASDFGKANGNISEAEVEKRYSASGDILCNGFTAQAQVVLKNDIIITSAHTLYGRHCETDLKPNSCRLVMKENGKLKMYEIESREAGGYKCPNEMPMKDGEDWLVMRLKKPVDSSIKPYQLTKPPCAKFLEQTDVVHVAKSEDFKPHPSGLLVNAPRHYGNCQVQHYECESKATTKLMYTDCDVSHGGSGGGLFMGGADPKLVAITGGIYDKCPEDAATQSGVYRLKCWNVGMVPVEDDFKKELLRVAGESKTAPAGGEQKTKSNPSRSSRQPKVQDL